MTDTDADHTPADTAATPESVFALVGHELRAEIIQVLGAEDTLTFSELRARLETDIEPSQLHYHLQQLVGHFLKKTDDGYRLRAVGYRLYQTLRAGTFDRQQTHLAVEDAFACYYCDAPVDIVFESGRVTGGCPECDYVYIDDLLDIYPDLFEDAATAFSYFSTYMALKIVLLARDICPSCAHPLTPTLESFAEQSTPRTVLIAQSCELCGARWSQNVGMALLGDAGLRSFCHDHGVDVLSVPYWELEFAATDKYVTVRSTDPWEVALQVPFEDETLELVVDGDLTVIERNHRTAADTGDESLLEGIRNSMRLMAHGEDEVVLPAPDDCVQYLRRHRWPAGVRCPHCASPDTTKDGTTSKNAQRYRCHCCDSIFNDLTGTVFAGHRLSLPEMFYISQAMEETSTAEITRHLDRSYKTVLGFVHEVRDACDEAV